ncbi:MAG: hypothetical protein JF564_07020 [Sphingomonas sp.]|nr:hypothetical protein [Sphingomonas sp.]
MQAIDSAVAEHPQMVERQREAVRWAFGEVDGACERAAHIVAEAIAKPSPKSSTLRRRSGGRVAALGPSP